MKSKATNLLLGTALLMVSAYSLAANGDESSTTDSDNAVIVTGPAPTDRQIRAEVIRQIDEKPALRTENIDVQSFHRNVYLYGAVDSRMDSEEAEAIARSAPGVVKVYNGLGTSGS